MIGRNSFTYETVDGIVIQANKNYGICYVHIPPINSLTKEEIKKIRNRFLWKFQGRQINDRYTRTYAFEYIYREIENEK